ncbi:hypothetical protein [Jeotgalibacillus malaysiensis]|uniref:hypothetical protein n=1 Tax=Jeotgalibacillus malaysiensis TaxID=1508404 RepID=UPI00384B046B
MVRKECPKCMRSSYSSSTRENWICPVCGEDLTTYPSLRAISYYELNQHFRQSAYQHSAK